MRNSIKLNQIEYLVAKRYSAFPASERDAYLSGMLDDFKTIDRQIVTYRTELATMSADQVQALYDEAKNENEQPEEKAEQHQQIESGLEKFLRFKFDPEFWAKMTFWTQEEATALTYGISPEAAREARLEETTAKLSIVEEYQKLIALVKRAEMTGHITNANGRITPDLFLMWIKKNDIPFPRELEKHITRIYGDLDNWETKYNDLKGEADLLKHDLDFITREADNLREVISQYEQREKAKPKSSHTRERDTLLKMIVGMALGGYGYDPKANKSSIAKEISDDLALHGIPLDQDTIRSKLKEGSLLIGQSTPNR